MNNYIDLRIKQGFLFVANFSTIILISYPLRVGARFLPAREYALCGPLTSS